MNKPSESFLPVWVTLSVLAGIIGSVYTYYVLTAHNPRASAMIGLKSFLLMYIIGWVIFRISRYVERTRPDGDDNDK